MGFVVTLDVEHALLPEQGEPFGVEDDVLEDVADAVFLGLNTHYFVKLDTGEDVEIIQESSIEDTLSKGARISLTVNTEKVNLFLKDGSKNILTGVQNDLDK